MDFYVPDYSSLLNNLNPQIAAGPPKVDTSFISNALENYDQGGKIKQDIGLRNIFQNGLPTDQHGNIDYGAVTQQLAKVGGASQLPNIINLSNQQLGRQVLQGTGLISGAPSVGSPPSSSTAIPSAGFGPQIASSASKYGVDQGTLTRQLSAESSMNPSAVSSKGATGVAQFMPKTAAQYGVNPSDPTSSIDGAAHYDADLLKKYNGNQGLALAAYNWGPGNLDAWLKAGGNPAAMPRETQAYVARVTGKPIQGWLGGNAMAFNGTPAPQGSPVQAAPAPTPAPASPQDRNALLANAYEQRAQYFYRQAEGLAFVNPSASAAAKAQADQAAQQALAIRKGLVANTELTPDEKNARASGAANPIEYQSNIEANKQDNDTFQKRYQGIQSLGQQSYNGLQKAQLMKQLTLDPNFYSGPLHEYAQTYNQFKSIFGSNPSSALPQEAFNKVANDMLTEQVKAMGQSGVGRVLQSEVNMMKQAIASLGITPQSNRALAEIVSRVYKQDQDIAQIARGLPRKTGHMNTQLDTAISQYLKEHPLFTQQELQHPQTIGAPDAPPQSAQWSPQQKRQWAQSIGLKPGDPIRFNGQLVQVP